MPEESQWSRPGGDTENTGPPASSATPPSLPGAAKGQHESPASDAGDAVATLATDGTTSPSTDAETPAEAPPPSHAAVMADSSGSTVIAVLGMMLLVLSALIVGLVVYVTSEDDGNFPTRLADDDYDLAAMALRERDTPGDLSLAGKLEFSNEEWSAILDSVDPEARLPQLEAQERVRNHISIFAWPDGGTFHLAQTLSLLSQSTLYESVSAAEEALAGSALCGLRLDETAPVDDFKVPAIGDSSVGFFVTTADPDIGTSIETVVCFRTGRVVHGVVQSALDGAQDIGLVVGLARKMLVHVENAFDGTADPLDEDPNEGG